jgi:hypothetical protein
MLKVLSGAEQIDCAARVSQVVFSIINHIMGLYFTKESLSFLITVFFGTDLLIALHISDVSQ